MHGKTPPGRPRRPSKPHGRRPTGGGKPKPRPAPAMRGPVGDPRLVYRRDPAAFGLRQAERNAIVGEAPACAIKALCGSCKYVNSDYKKSLELKFQAGLTVLRDAGVLSIAKVLPVVESPRPLGYRALFKLAVRPIAQREPVPGAAAPAPVEPPRTDVADGWTAADAVPESEGAVAVDATPPPKRFAIGLFEPGTHDVIDMDDCPLHTAPLRRLLKDLRDELDASPVVPFDEKTGDGQLRYIAARAAHLTGEIMLTFVVRAPIKSELRALTQRLQRRGHKINSAHMNVHEGPGNAIFGGDTVRVSGADRLRERLCDLDFEIGPTSFFQVNPWQAINLYRRVEMIAGHRGAPARRVGPLLRHGPDLSDPGAPRVQGPRHRGEPAGRRRRPRQRPQEPPRRQGRFHRRPRRG